MGDRVSIDMSAAESGANQSQRGLIVASNRCLTPLHMLQLSS
jgi:hypothetical protein